MYNYIKDESNFYDLALELSESNIKEVYCDLETTGLDPRTSKILLFQIMAGNEIYIFDFLKLNNEHLKYLVNLLITTKVISVFQNTKFDIKFLYHNTGKWLMKLGDVMNAEVLLNSGIGESVYSLKYLANKYCGIDLTKDDRKLFYEGEVREITEQMLQYSAMDVKVLEPIYKKQLELIKEAKEDKIYEIEMELLPVIANMEYNGVLIDKDAWSALEGKERERLDKAIETLKELFIESLSIEKYADALELAKAVSIPVKTKKLQNQLVTLTSKDTISEWFRQNINFRSPKQLKTALNLVGVDVDSIDKKVLNKLKKTPIIECLLERSEATKRIDTYGIGVFEFINPISGRIHTEFLDMGTATGRLSSGNPINLQNIPNAEGYREAFIARPDYEWISADYSQQEFRLCGSTSGEQKIIDAYLQGADMHTATAALIYNKALKDINKKERFIGKTANFTIIYGGTEYALGKNLGLDNDTAVKILKAFHDGYPMFSAFKESAEAAILKLGYSITRLGRRRYNPPKPIYMTNAEYMRYINRVKREGFNHIIQGGAADITKIAMINIWKNNPFGELLKMLIQVHDEIDFEAHKSISKDAREFVKEEMIKAEQPFLGVIPAAVDLSPVSDHWIH